MRLPSLHKYLGAWLLMALLGLPACQKHIAIAPAAPVPGWSGFHAPLDLIWKLDSGLDANGLPIDAKWSAQFTAQGRPDFKDTCAPAFVVPHVQKGTKINDDAIGKCTSQTRELDVRPKNIITDPATLFLCPAKPLRGHLNWGVATYTGTLQFTGWSSDLWLFDDDLNFTLGTPEDAGLTALSDGPGKGLHLEFRASETLDHFANVEWWSSFNKEIHQKSPFLKSNLPLLGKPVNNRIAVITGLVGVDGVHGGYTESHPVYAMAIREDTRQTQSGVEETWEFFLRNHGTEGDCSLQEHHWSDFHGAYYIEVPWPAGATAVRAAGEPKVWSYLNQEITRAGLERAAQCTLADKSDTCTLLKLEVRDSQLPIGVYGEMKLAYTIPPEQPSDAKTGNQFTTPATPEFEGGRPEKIRRLFSELGATTNEVRRHLPKEFAQVEEKKASLRVTTTQAPVARSISVDLTIVDHLWPMVGGHREGSLRPDVASPSPSKEHENVVLNQAQAK